MCQLMIPMKFISKISTDDSPACKSILTALTNITYQEGFKVYGVHTMAPTRIRASRSACSVSIATSLSTHEWRLADYSLTPDCSHASFVEPDV